MSKKTPNSPLDVVTALMQERAKFENWLATLESRRDATPPNVYDRVRQDYEKRLAGVVEELGTHAAELESQAERYATRLGELGDQEQAKREERAEAELRAHVGELSPDEWEVMSREADDALAALAAEQAVVGADLNRVYELLGAATGATPASAKPEPEPEPEAEPEPPQAAAAEPEPEPAPAPASSPKPQAAPAVEPEPARASSATPEQASFDELAFLKSVVSPYGSQTPVKPPAPGTDSGPHFTQDPTEALTESLVSRANRPSQERAFIREDADDAAAGLVGRAEEPGERPYAANVTGNHPIVLRPSGAVEQPKTLKCAECAAMNYPTEWYCERCGAELASL
ncbi:MAG TPA: hypothetical protein VMV51_06625 [Gemmatimonadaceae bacterium]|nr:hypothetical protein [Gemmatimonadaceae bacterium]